MSESATNPQQPAYDPAYDVGHTHPDISGGWLRAATFGAMDGLVSNTALIAGVAAGESAHAVTVAGIAGLLAGAFSMALGEYSSVTTANEQIESEVHVERKSLRTRPQAEREELIGMLIGLGLTEKTAEAATDGNMIFGRNNSAGERTGLFMDVSPPSPSPRPPPSPPRWPT